MARLELLLLDNDDEHVVIANALVAALGAGAVALRRGEIAAIPDDAVPIVFAAELPAYLAALPADRRAKLIERTLVLNAYRDEVLGLLETHGFGGAIECEDPAGWADYGTMFVRKAALSPRKGEAVSGAGRESARYVLWTIRDRTAVERTCSLAKLVDSYGAEAWRFSNRDDRLLVTSGDARAHGLPAISVSVNIGRVAMAPTRFPTPTGYLQLYQAFGSGLWFSVEHDPDGGTIVDAAGRKLVGEHVPPILGELEHVMLAGGSRTAVACVTGPANSVASGMKCYLRVPHRTGDLLVTFATAARSREPSCAYVLAVPELKVLADSLTIVDDQA